MKTVLSKKKIAGTAVGLCAVLAAGITIYCVSRHRIAAEISDYAQTYASENNMSVDDVLKNRTIVNMLKQEYKHDAEIERQKSQITVSSEEIADFKNMIGTSMDEKRAMVILFDTEKNCSDFISEYGGRADDYTLGKGVTPQLNKSGDKVYYNVTGNPVFEEVFNELADGEYTKAPVEYSGVYCYIRRIELYSPANDDLIIEDMIKNEKISAGGGNG